MVAALRVSALNLAPASASAWMTGTILAISVAAGIAGAFGRVLSPPTSMISAPASSIANPAAIASAWVACWPPSEKESGVTFRIPITKGAARLNPAQVEIRLSE